MINAEELERIWEERKGRFRILVCIDGSEESYRGLRYAARMGSADDADIILLYVRPHDQGLGSGGLQVRVARENMLDWGLELPGIQYLHKGRDLLIELGRMEEGWEEISSHIDVAGDPLGDIKMEYRSKVGKSIVLKLKTAPDVASGILDQYELGPYNIVILGASRRERGLAMTLLDPTIADRIALLAPCSVLIARDLEVGHGHLICTTGSEHASEMIGIDAEFASRCKCPVSLLTVIPDVESEVEARLGMTEGIRILKTFNIEPAEILTQVGDPVAEIVELSPDYSVTVLADARTSRLRRFFASSITYKVLQKAHNSVLIVR